MVQASLRELESPAAKYPAPRGDAASRGLVLQPPVNSTSKEEGVGHAALGRRMKVGSTGNRRKGSGSQRPGKKVMKALGGKHLEEGRKRKDGR